MSTWEATNKLETLVYKISNAADVLEMIAVEEQDPTSGALWFMRDSLKSLAKEYEHEVEELYRPYRVFQNIHIQSCIFLIDYFHCICFFQ